jgi:hypothetical protein
MALSPSEARPKSTPRPITQQVKAFIPKALASGRCTPTAKTKPAYYSKPSECC